MGCFPDEEVPAGRQLLATRRVVAVEALSATAAGPLLAVTSASPSLPADPRWRALHLVGARAPGAALGDPASDRDTGPGVFAHDLYLARVAPAGARDPDAAAEASVGDLLVLGASGAPLARIEGVLGLRVTARGYFARARHDEQGERLHLGGGGGPPRWLGAVREADADADGRVYFARVDGRLERSDGPDRAPVLLADDVRAFALARAGTHVLIVGREGRRAVRVLRLSAPGGVPAGERTLLEPEPETCATMLPLPGGADFLCVGAARDRPDRVTLAWLDPDGAARSVVTAEPLAELRAVSTRPDGARALLHFADRTVVVPRDGPPVTLPEPAWHLRFSDDSRFAAYAAGPRGQYLHLRDGDLRTLVRLVDEPFAPLDFELLPALGGAQWLVYMARSRTGTTHLWAVHLPGAGAPSAPRHLAEGVASFQAIDDARLLALVDVRGQDRTGALVVLDLARGTRAPIAAAVTSFALGGACLGCTAAPGDVPAGQVAYVVRSRAPHPRDGVWLAPLP